MMPGLGSVNTGLLHQEISRLNALLEDKMSEYVRLGREVEDTRRRDQERIQTLEQQVGVTMWSQCVEWHLLFFTSLKKI